MRASSTRLRREKIVTTHTRLLLGHDSGDCLSQKERSVSTTMVAVSSSRWR